MIYEFEYNMPAFGNAVATGAMGVVVALLIIIVLLALAFSIASYVLSAVGMYRIAKRRGIHHPWLAWIPIGASWLLGSISDHYQYVAKHKVTKRRRVLLILNLIAAVPGFVYGLSAMILGIDGGSVGAAAIVVLSYLCLLGLSLAAMVICYIAYYDLFRSCKPGNAVLFLILSIFFNVTLPVFVFICSNSDLGMPERRSPKPMVPECAEEETAEEEIPVVETELVDDFTEE